MIKQDNGNNIFAQTSFLYGGNADYIDKLYAAYENDPQSVDKEWQEFFANFSEDKQIVVKNAQGASWQKANWPHPARDELLCALDGDWRQVEEALKQKAAKSSGKDGKAALDERALKDSMAAIRLIRAYRSFGHLHANLDPLGIEKSRDDYQMLSPETYGLTMEDANKTIYLGGLLGFERASLAQILTRLKQIYCGTVGVEFMHIADPNQRAWIQERMEGAMGKAKFSAEEKRLLLSKLIEAEGFEQFLDTKYKGAKRFGLDGGEALIPALEALIQRAAQHKVEEIVFGMAHRGRLNVLSQIVGKPHRAIFHEFKGGSYKPSDIPGSGDVKYHLGASCDRQFAETNMHLSLVPNPSHLEIVNPVVVGKTRARQDARLGASRAEFVAAADRLKVLGVLLHGDAAFAGQGVVQEVLGLSGLKGYSISGSIHIIINNQIGFTTNPNCSRSTCYPSDIAKMVNAPIFHVNGDDVEAVAFVAQIAMDFRQTFCRPVVVDMYCYRRFGHNEGDEPAFTQPLMYKNIRAHQALTEIYGAQLMAEDILSKAEFDAQKQSFRARMEEAFEAAESYVPAKADWLEGKWSGLVPASSASDRLGKTGVKLSILQQIGQNLIKIPENFKLHKTVQRFIENRAAMLRSGEGLDWATAEALAFGSLLLEGTPVRISGEDVERGTFSQRHSVLYDQDTENRHVLLNHLAAGQALYQPVNSMLSEEAVLGYEYGYSIASPLPLAVWEAQFGDFANGAQVIFDQFISSAESKWLRMSGLVCLLPHGFEGQGPEHSSARLERYLQLCAEDNMQVANCSTPANYFHILRRQIHRNFRKPLILMTPKSLLRHKRAISKMSEMAENTHFQPVLLDDAERNGSDTILQKDEKIFRVVLCSGKVYYDLYEERQKRGIDNIYLLRVEELYPFPRESLAKILIRFKHADIVWCQEEPKNMGAWHFVEPYLEEVLTKIGATKSRAAYAGRPASASPAAGLMSEHNKQLAAFLEEALG